MTSPQPKFGNYTKKKLCFPQNPTFYVPFLFIYFAPKNPKFGGGGSWARTGHFVPLHGQERVIGKNGSLARTGHWQERVICTPSWARTGHLHPLYGRTGYWPRTGHIWRTGHYVSKKDPFPLLGAIEANRTPSIFSQWKGFAAFVQKHPIKSKKRKWPVFANDPFLHSCHAYE